MLGQQFGESFFHQMLDYGRGFPEKPVAVGDTWPFQTDMPAGPTGKVKLDVKLTFKGMETHQEHRCAALASKATFDATGGIEAGPMGKMNIENGKAEGMSWFDPEQGALIESESTQTMRLTGDMPGGAPGAPKPANAPKFTVEMSQKISLTLVEIGKAK